MTARSITARWRRAVIVVLSVFGLRESQPENRYILSNRKPAAVPTDELRIEIKQRNDVVHELSIAQNIFDIIYQSVPREELQCVRTVRMKVGTLSGVVPDSLGFCFSAIASETALSRATLSIERVPFRIKCNSCEHEFTNNIGFVVCPQCGGVETIVLSGRELLVTEIELDEQQ